MSKIITDRPFVQQSMLTDRWWLVTRWRELDGGMREAVEKYPFDDAVAQIQARPTQPQTPEWTEV